MAIFAEREKSFRAFMVIRFQRRGVLTRCFFYSHREPRAFALLFSGGVDSLHAIEIELLVRVFHRARAGYYYGYQGLGETGKQFRDEYTHALADVSVGQFLRKLSFILLEAAVGQE